MSTESKSEVSGSTLPKYCMVATDLDSTLLNNKHQISERNAAMLRKLHDMGLHVVLCSGRMAPCMHPYERALRMDLNMVSYNGAVAFATESCNRSTYFLQPVPPSVTKRVLGLCDEWGLTCNIYHQDISQGGISARVSDDSHRRLTERYRLLTSCTYSFIDDHGPFVDSEPYKLLILTEGSVEELYDKVRESLSDVLDDVHLIQAEYFVEILNKKANKRSALTALCQSLNIDMGQVVAFGDGNNDVEFMQGAGFGVAMSNAQPECKKHADKVSCWSNEEDAVARELELLLASGQLVPHHEPAPHCHDHDHDHDHATATAKVELSE